MRGFVIMALFFVGACQQQPTPRIFEGPDVDAIRAADESLNEAIEQRDAAAALEHYQVLGALITEYLRVDEMSVGASGSYERLMEDPNSAIVYNYAHVEVSRSGDMAHSDGECAVTRTNPATSQPETYLGVCMKLWINQDGRWVIAREMRAPIHNRD